AGADGVRRTIRGLLADAWIGGFAGIRDDRRRGRPVCLAVPSLRGALFWACLGGPFFVRRRVPGDPGRRISVGAGAVGHPRRVIIVANRGNDEGEGAQANGAEDGGGGRGQRPERDGRPVAPARWAKAFLTDGLQDASGEVGGQARAGEFAQLASVLLKPAQQFA